MFVEINLYNKFLLNNAIFTILQELTVLSNEELKIKFKNGYKEFWLQKLISQLYPGLWSIVQRFLIAFPSSYLAEHGFSPVAMLITKKRNRFHVTQRCVLWLFLSKIVPDINKLLKMHQIQLSH